MLKEGSSLVIAKTVPLFLVLWLFMVLTLSMSSTVLAQNSAVESGQVLQGFVRKQLKPKGFSFVTHREWLKDTSERNSNEKIVITSVPYTSMYGHRGRMQFLLKAPTLQRDVYIVPRIQNVRGSVDEKLPYFYYNYRRLLENNDVMVVLAGKGWKSESVQWLRDMAKNEKGFIIYNHEQFAEWVNQMFSQAQE